MAIEKHVAIIGGGAAGLTAAYFLHGRLSADGSTVFRCTVFDVQKRLGGNCFSAYLGQQAFRKPFVDLGVNDFNTERYHNFMALLAQLEMEGYPVPHAPLIDTTTWYTPRGVTQGARSYTNDEMENWEQHRDKPWLRAIARDWDRFQDIGYSVLHDPSYENMSVDDLIAQEGYSEDFAEYNLRARINGMYYSNGRSPGEMPIRAVMSYYHLQEGIGDRRKTTAARLRKQTAADEDSPRHYFVNGASDWISQLTKCLVARGLQLRLGASPTAYLDPALGWRVLSGAPPIDGRESFDHVISAVHADEVSRVIAVGLPALMPTFLAQFRYLDAMAIVHDDVQMLPADPAQWSNYNILVYPPGTQSLRPYTITYVDRKHQGQDTNAPPYLTLTPYGAVQDRGIPDMMNLPSSDRVKAIAYLRHNTTSLDSMAAQKYLPAMQGNDGLWFTGGWANGAGLHEEIIALSKEIALRIRGIFLLGEHGETYRKDDPSYVPKHVRDTFATSPKPFPDGFWD